MNFSDLTQKLTSFKAALFLDDFLKRSTRSSIRYFFLILSFTFFAASFIDFKGTLYNSLPDGLFFIFISLFLILFLLEAFYNSSRFSSNEIDFEVAQIIYKTNEANITAGFLDSTPVVDLLFRLGIGVNQKESFLNSEREVLRGEHFEVENGGFSEYAKALYKSDKSFASFIGTQGVNTEDFDGAVDWIVSELAVLAKRERWWSRESLEVIASLGTSFSYGIVYELSKYASPVYLESVDLANSYRKKEITQVENALVRGAEANAIIVDDDETVSKDIVARLAKKIKLGAISSVLEHKVVLELDWNALSTDHKSKAELENEFLKLLSECAGVGNIILYIPNLPTFISEAKKNGVNLPAIMEEYLTSPSIHIIGHATKADFYYFIEINPGLGRVFERIVPEEAGPRSALPVLLEKAKQIEQQYEGKLFFTYPALREVAELSDRFMTYGEMPTKALDMLIELAPWATRSGIGLVLKNDVAMFASSKTGIAAGEIGTAEREKLSKLEKILHERIVGQDEAVSAVSSAMRRSRAGVGNPKRPIASFLFLGPTGVGKTETSKALAESFFGPSADGEKITRFDMSEYKGLDALPRLLGSFSESKIGNLSSKLRDNPYGVVLLDEFEKAAPDVLNLFLRILDEGKFTDAFGSEVSVRNAIIIATSNAGSELIWKIVKDGGKLEEKKDLIVDHLIDQHIFKPELLNRFDAIVLFKPLQTIELRAVAEKELHKLILRLRGEKQIELKPSSELLDYLVLHGSDREFGARSINRIMQNKIEDALAKKIIAGQALAGSVVEIGVKDIL